MRIMRHMFCIFIILFQSCLFRDYTILLGINIKLFSFINIILYSIRDYTILPFAICMTKVSEATMMRKLVTTERVHFWETKDLSDKKVKSGFAQCMF